MTCIGKNSGTFQESLTTGAQQEVFEVLPTTFAFDLVAMHAPDTSAADCMCQPATSQLVEGKHTSMFTLLELTVPTDHIPLELYVKK
jgi:hypothetical protein